MAPKIALFVRLMISSNIDQFKMFFTVRSGRKFVIVSLLSLKIQPHLKCAATLPVKCQCL